MDSDHKTSISEVYTVEKVLVRCEKKLSLENKKTKYR